MTGNSRRILITRTDRLGDVVLSTPAIRLLREQNPDAYIAFMVRPENFDVVSNNPHLDEVIIYDKRGIHKSFWSTINFAFRLRKKGFDMAIALHPTNRVHVMLFLAGISRRIGYDRKMGCLLTEKIFHDKQEGTKHEVDYNFDLLKKCGLDTDGADRLPYVVTDERQKKRVDFILEENEIGDNIIAFHPGASCPSKRWPPERFIQVADMLVEKYGCDIVVVGSGETKTYSSQIVSEVRSKAFDLTQKLSIGELSEVLSRCRLFISNDSGPVHVSVAVGTPTVVIFGRSDPGLSPLRWGPLGESDKVLHKDVGCQKCLAHNCERHFECLQAVTDEEVFQASVTILKQKT